MGRKGGTYDYRMTFYKELLYSVLFPLSLPLLYYFEGGTVGIINRQYWGSRLAIHEWVCSISCKLYPYLLKVYGCYSVCFSCSPTSTD